MKILAKKTGQQNFIWGNAVSFADHKHYHSNKRSYHYIRRTSDRLCKEHGLSVIIPGQDKGKEYAILTDEISRAWSGMTTGPVSYTPLDVYKRQVKAALTFIISKIHWRIRKKSKTFLLPDSDRSRQTAASAMPARAPPDRCCRRRRSDASRGWSPTP